MNPRPPNRGQDRALLTLSPGLRGRLGGPGRTALPEKKSASMTEALLAIFCPADAVLAKLPFPSKQGWITVGALLTSNQGLSLNRAQPSLHGINHIGFGALARNPEHRRAKYMYLPWKGRKKLERTIRVVLLRDARLATLLVVGARYSLHPG